MRTNAITKLTTKTNCVGTGEFYAARDHGTSVTTTRGECYQAMRKSAGDLTATLRRDPQEVRRDRKGSESRLSSWWT